MKESFIPEIYGAAKILVKMFVPKSMGRILIV
jgi:hypothetical protein